MPKASKTTEILSAVEAVKYFSKEKMTLTEIKFKQALVQATELLEAVGQHDISTLLNLLFGSLITTIESKDAEIAEWKEKEFRACSKHHEFHSELELKDALIEFQKEEIEKLKKSMRYAHTTLTHFKDDIGTRNHYAALHLEIALQEGESRGDT